MDNAGFGRVPAHAVTALIKDAFVAAGLPEALQASVLACRSRSAANARADNDAMFIAQVTNPQAFVNASY